MSFIVKMNGQNFASFDTRKDAENYISMQQSKRKGGCEKGPFSPEKMAYAAKQKWEVTEE